MSSSIGTFFGLLFTLGIVWCVAGVLWRLIAYARTPQRQPIPLTPAATTVPGVLLRLSAETFLFRSLWRACPITWAASMAFHYALLLLVLVHLRFLFVLFPLWLLPVLMISALAAILMMTGLAVLLWRRLWVDRLRYVSTPSDYLYLLLLLAIAVSGVLLKRVWPADLQMVGEFVRSLGWPPWAALPAHPLLIIHLALVLLLLWVFPLGKLLHGLALWFTPTLAQRDPSGAGSAARPPVPSKMQPKVQTRVQTNKTLDKR